MTFAGQMALEAVLVAALLLTHLTEPKDDYEATYRTDKNVPF